MLYTILYRFNVLVGRQAEQGVELVDLPYVCRDGAGGCGDILLRCIFQGFVKGFDGIDPAFADVRHGTGHPFTDGGEVWYFRRLDGQHAGAS